MTQISAAVARCPAGTTLVFKLRPGTNSARRLPLAPANQIASQRAGQCANQTVNEEHLLVARAKSGQADAFGELYKRHQQQAYGTALRILRNEHDAEDAVQRAFQRALVNLRRFRGDSTFSTWLMRIVINDALMQLRQRRSREPLQTESIDAPRSEGGVEAVDAGPTPEEILCAGERRTTLLQAVGTLRNSLKVVILQGELQGLTSVETAQRLGLSVAAVKTRTFHARRIAAKASQINLRDAERTGRA